MIKQASKYLIFAIVSALLISCDYDLTQDDLYEKYSSCYEAQDYECALNYISLLVDADSNNIYWRRYRADVYMNLSRADKAISDVRYTVDNGLAYSEEYLLLFDIYRFLGQEEDAEKALLSGIRKAKNRRPFSPAHVNSVNPGEEELFVNLHRFYMKSSEEEKACEIAEDGLKRNSASNDLKKAVAICREG